MSLPIIYVTGATSTGKGTLGQRLAAEFGFYHISMGDIRRNYLAKLRAGAPGVDDDIRPYILEGKRVPSGLLKRYKTIPAILLYHNHRAGPEDKHPWTFEIASAMLGETLAEQKTAGERGGTYYRAIVLDGHPLTNGTLSKELVAKYQADYSGLTIVIECPRDQAKERYIARARLPSETGDRFESRMAVTDRILPEFLRMMASYGEVVKFTNDNAMTIDEAYRALVAKLSQSQAFYRLIQAK